MTRGVCGGSRARGSVRACANTRGRSRRRQRSLRGACRAGLCSGGRSGERESGRFRRRGGLVVERTESKCCSAGGGSGGRRAGRERLEWFGGERVDLESEKPVWRYLIADLMSFSLSCWRCRRTVFLHRKICGFRLLLSWQMSSRAWTEMRHH